MSSGRKTRAAQAYTQNQAGIQKQGQALIDQMQKQYGAYTAQMENALTQAPRYNIPSQVSQLIDNNNAYANQFDTMAKAVTDNSAYAKSLRDIYSKGIAESEKQSNQAAKEGLSGINTFTSYYRNLANRNELPGQTAIEQKLNRSTAEGYRNIQKSGAGSTSALGASVDLYTNKMDTLSDIGVQAANYKAQNEQNLASSLERSTAMKTDIYNQLAASTLGRTQLSGSVEESLNSDSLNRQQMAAGLLGNASNLRTSGMQFGADYANRAYEQNELNPYNLQLSYLSQMQQASNPFAAQMQLLGAQSDSNLNLYSLFGKAAVPGRNIFTGVVGNGQVGNTNL